MSVALLVAGGFDIAPAAPRARPNPHIPTVEKMHQSSRLGQTGECSPKPAPVLKQCDAVEDPGPIDDSEPDPNRLRDAREGDAQFGTNGGVHGVIISGSQPNHLLN